MKTIYFILAFLVMIVCLVVGVDHVIGDNKLDTDGTAGALLFIISCVLYILHKLES